MKDMFIFHSINDYEVPTLLREANSATNPWDGMDWVTQLLATAKEKVLLQKNWNG